MEAMTIKAVNMSLAVGACSFVNGRLIKWTNRGILMTRKAKRDFQSNNTSGVTGVCEVFKANSAAWVASWRDDDCNKNTHRNKWFCYKEDCDVDRKVAYNKAIRWRKAMVKEHYDE